MGWSGRRPSSTLLPPSLVALLPLPSQPRRSIKMRYNKHSRPQCKWNEGGRWPSAIKLAPCSTCSHASYLI